MNLVESNGQSHPDFAASDPVKLGWMRGAPPPVELCVSRDLDDDLSFPKLRWSVCHMRELRPTIRIRRGAGPASSLPRTDDMPDIDMLTFADAGGHVRTFQDALSETYTDGIVVLHRGRIVYERYFGALDERRPHACFAVTKSFVGTLAAALVHEHVLADEKLIPYYVPELSGTAWEDATVRQVMDMQTRFQYSERNTGEHSGLREYSLANGYRSRPAGYAGPKSLYDFLRTLRKDGAHGQDFAYRTPNTDVLGWVLARVTGQSFAEMIEERFWAPLGFEQDGDLLVDSVGIPLLGGGLNASLRDLARFGELMRREGEWAGRQVIPASAVRDVKDGGEPAKFNYPGLPGYSYRNMWWVSHNELGAFEAKGIHGQRLYVAPKADMVVARYGSHPVASSAGDDPIIVPQMLALGRMLQE